MKQCQRQRKQELESIKKENLTDNALFIDKRFYLLYQNLWLQCDELYRKLFLFGLQLP